MLIVLLVTGWSGPANRLSPVATGPTLWAAPRPTGSDPGEQVLQICQRINGIMQAVLDLERDLIFRLERGRPIDWQRMVARFASARRQIVGLRRLALRLEPRIPAGHPALAKIQSLKSQLRGAVKTHRERAAKIVAAGGEACRSAITQVDTACEHSEPAPDTVPFPVRSIDDQM